MGDKNLDASTNEHQEVSYKIKVYKGVDLPKDFHNLILAPFLNSLRYGNELFKLIDKDAYFTKYDKFVEHLISRPDAFIKIAMLDDVALGWSLYERNVLHYVWVKKEVRRQGIGRALVPVFDTISHITNIGLSCWVSKFPEVKFDPFI